MLEFDLKFCKFDESLCKISALLLNYVYDSCNLMLGSVLYVERCIWFDRAETWEVV